MSGLRKFFSSSATNSSACALLAAALALSAFVFAFLGGGEGVLLAELLPLALLLLLEPLLELLLELPLELELLELELSEVDDADALEDARRLCLRRPIGNGDENTLSCYRDYIEIKLI